MKKLNENGEVVESRISHGFIRNVVLDIVLTIVTCGLFNVYVQYCQILAINDMLKEERYSFLQWFLFSLVTCGLYHIYHEYVKGIDIDKCTNQPNGNMGVICLLLTLFGLSIIADAIQQNHINSFYGKNGP